MNDKLRLTRQIHAYDFSILEMELYLDVHPHNQRALNLLSDLRKKRAALVSAYEQRFGAFVVTKCDVPIEDHWHWIHSPWPWEAKEGE
ncbi:MAG: spore coat protein CotJB [Clostridia bacterium]|nr:spore coat protein CotJB [Clostridia bacterium]